MKIDTHCEIVSLNKYGPVNVVSVTKKYVLYMIIAKKMKGF